MKIDIIGAAYPFRGGNAHYTTLLYLNLKKKHDVRLYSYKKQYPRFLFPGETDKDPSLKTFKVDEVMRTLDYSNPFSWYLTYKKIKEDSPDLLIFSWITEFAAFQFWLISALVKKFTKIKILFICHNVKPHEPSLIKKLLSVPVFKNADYFIVHSEDDLKDLKEIIPRANVKKAHLPIYDIFKLENLDKEESKKHLGLSGKVLLFFGLIRKYKGLEYLLRAMPLVLDKVDTKLLIVGEFWEDKKIYEDIISELSIGNKVKIVDKYVPNEDVGMYFSACDLVILPYVTVTGSGIIQIANAFNKPAVASNIGCLPDVIEDRKTGYLVEPKDPSSLAGAIIEYFSDPENEKIFAGNIEKKKKEFSWDRMVELIENIFTENP